MVWLPAIVLAQEVDLVLPPRSKSAAVTAFAFPGPTRAVLGRGDAFCDLDLAQKDLRCRKAEGVVSALAVTETGGGTVILSAETTHAESESGVGTCAITLHAYDPATRGDQALTAVELPCLLGREVHLLASASPAGAVVTVLTDHALQVLPLRASASGLTVEPGWRYTSRPRAEGWLASGIAAAASERAVYVLERWNQFAEGQVEVLRHDLARGRAETLVLPVPRELAGTSDRPGASGPSFLLVSADDAHLVLVGQVGADPGHFLAYDLATRRPRCHFTDRSLRGLNAFEDVLLTAGHTILAASVEGVVVELDLCGKARGRTRVDYLPAQLPGDLLRLQVSADGRRLYALLDGGAVSILPRGGNEPLASLFLLEQDEWVALLPEGYYSASRRGHDYLGILREDEVVGLNQFYDAFYRPDLVDRRLAGQPVEDLMAATLQEAIRQPPPRVTIVAAPKGAASEPTEVRYQVESTGGGIGEVRVFHNGKLIWSDGTLVEPAELFARSLGVRDNTPSAIVEELRGLVVPVGPGAGTAGGARRPLLQSRPKGERFEGTVTVTPVAGDNEITVTAFNAANTVQSQMRSAAFRSSSPARPANLHIVAVGIDHYRDAGAELRYAAKDARDVARRLAAQGRTLYPAARIHARVLTDTQATRAGLLATLEQLAAEVGPEDQFVLFVASHGVLLGGQYYMLTHDYAGRLERDTVIGSGELIDVSRRIGALSQLIVLDTCHAGGMDPIVAGLYDARISVLARKMGLHIYASAGSLEAALDGFRGNGLFTHTLLQGLADNPDTDRNRDGEVSVVELGRYADGLTRALSARVGHRQRPVIIEFGRDRALYALPTTPSR
jgi:hypothetical protein